VDTEFASGRPRHPQSQGSVERANVDVKEMLATWLSENNSTQWSEGLRFIQWRYQLHSMTMVSVSNSMVGSLLSVELCAVT
jgi:hypothetical protein